MFGAPRFLGLDYDQGVITTMNQAESRSRLPTNCCDPAELSGPSEIARGCKTRSVPVLFRPGE
jgi:hypothetical protein